MDGKPECFDVEADSVYDEPKESTFVTEDELLGQVFAKSIAKIPDGDIKEELKIEIQ